MAEVVEQQDLTPAGADRWQVWYRVRRNDGEEVFGEASCTRTAEEVARAQTTTRRSPSSRTVGKPRFRG